MQETMELQTTQFRISSKHGVIVLPHNQAVADLLPKTKTINQNGREFMLVPYATEPVKLLNNLGVNVPPPIMHQYDWRGTTPFVAQEATAAMLTTSPRAFVLNSIGTGKTRAAAFAADFLKQAGEINKILVIAPLSTLTAVWENELFTVFPDWSVRVLHHTNSRRRFEWLEEDHDVYVVNHDFDRVPKFTEALAAKGFDLCIYDELTACKTANTNRWKATKKVTQKCKYLWGMTGSPTPQSPEDAFGQIKLIRPENLATPYFRAFREEVMRQVTPFRWMPKADANDKVFNYMQPGVRFTQDECVDLPDIVYSSRTCDMAKDQKRAYQEMQTEMALTYKGGTIDASNAGVQMSKLLQLASGFVYARDGQGMHYPPDNKLKLLREVIAEADKKVIVYCPFRKGVDLLVDWLREDATLHVEKVYGDTPKTQRDLLFNQFQNSEQIKVLVAHPQVAAHGLTLTSANVICWWSPIASNEIYEQACGRIRRPGQDTKCLVIHLENSAVERRVYRALKARGDVQSDLLQMYKDITHAR